MATGYVLINTASAKEHEVYNEIKKFVDAKDSGFKEVHPLFGEYDLIAKIETDDFDGLRKIVLDEVRTIDGVVNTKTLTGKKF